MVSSHHDTRVTGVTMRRIHPGDPIPGIDVKYPSDLNPIPPHQPLLPHSPTPPTPPPPPPTPRETASPNANRSMMELSLTETPTPTDTNDLLSHGLMPWSPAGAASAVGSVGEWRVEIHMDNEKDQHTKSSSSLQTKRSKCVVVVE